MDLFVFDNIGGVQQVFINRAGAFVVQLALRGLDAVNLGFEQGAEHGFVSLGRFARFEWCRPVLAKNHASLNAIGKTHVVL